MPTDLIAADRQVMLRKPCVRGTRIIVELIPEKLGAGESIERLLDAHPRLTREGIIAALNDALGVLQSVTSNVAHATCKVPA